MLARQLPRLGMRLVRHRGQLVLVLEHQCGGDGCRESGAGGRASGDRRKPAAVTLTWVWLSRVRALVEALTRDEQVARPNYFRVSRRLSKHSRGNWSR